MPFDFSLVPEDFSVATPEQLDELLTQANTAAQPLAEQVRSGADLTDEDLDTLERLAGVVDGVTAERTRRAEEEAAGAAKAGRASNAASKFAAAPVAPAAPADPAPVDPAPVTASFTPAAPAPRVGQIARAVPLANRDDFRPAAEGSFTRMVAGAQVPGLAVGSEFANILDAAAAIDEVAKTFGGMGEGMYHKVPTVQFRREYPTEYRITAGDTTESALAKLDAVARAQRLGVGPEALVATAGWCAPSQILYDLFELENGTDGILDLPELQISRGGVQVTPGPDFSSIFSGAGYWHQTEAQVQASTSKPTMVIPCPSFTDNRLEVEGVQITGAFLQDRGYPEMVARFVRGAMIAHQRKLNLFAINKVANGSVTADYTNVTNLPVTTTEYKDLTVISRLLAVAGIQIMDYKYKYRMPFKATLECVLPYWVVESVAADVQRRMGTSAEEAFASAYDQVTTWFARRNARLQLVYDWQDAYNVPGSGTNTSTNLGSATLQYQLPTTIYMLLYAAGTWVRGVSDVIRLDTVYDSTNLAVNQYTKLFTEDGVQVIKRGFESRMVKVTIDPSGTTSATANMITG